jgi:hypothetical protein
VYRANNIPQPPSCKPTRSELATTCCRRFVYMYCVDIPNRVESFFKNTIDRGCKDEVKQNRLCVRLHEDISGNGDISPYIHNLGTRQIFEPG